MSTKDFSNVQEHLVADVLGDNWSVVAGSGAAPTVPGDVIGDDWLLECKTHVEPTTKIKFMEKHWVKIKIESVVKHRSPALVTDNGTQKSDHTWVLLRTRNVPDISAIKLIDLNIKATTNLNLIEADLNKAIKNYPGEICGIKCKLDCDDCIVMKLSHFAEMVG